MIIYNGDSTLDISKDVKSDIFAQIFVFRVRFVLVIANSQYAVRFAKLNLKNVAVAKPNKLSMNDICIL